MAAVVMSFVYLTSGLFRLMQSLSATVMWPLGVLFLRGAKIDRPNSTELLAGEGPGVGGGRVVRAGHRRLTVALHRLVFVA